MSAPLHRITYEERAHLAALRHRGEFLYNRDGEVVIHPGRVLDCLTAEREAAAGVRRALEVAAAQLKEESRPDEFTPTSRAAALRTVESALATLRYGEGRES